MPRMTNQYQAFPLRSSTTVVPGGTDIDVSRVKYEVLHANEDCQVTAEWRDGNTTTIPVAAGMDISLSLDIIKISADAEVMIA